MELLLVHISMSHAAALSNNNNNVGGELQISRPPAWITFEDGAIPLTLAQIGVPAFSLLLNPT